MIKDQPPNLQLYMFILYYRACLAKAVHFLNERSKKEKHFHVRLKSGFLDEEHKISFSFHGIGCTIETDEFRVSIDFDEFGRCDGFTAHIIHSFFYHNRIQEQFQSLKSLGVKEIEQLLKGLTDQGLVLKRDFLLLGSMYVLPEDYHSEEPLRWIQ